MFLALLLERFVSEFISGTGDGRGVMGGGEGRRRGEHLKYSTPRLMFMLMNFSTQILIPKRLQASQPIPSVKIHFHTIYLSPHIKRPRF